jgi:hypothetical protein
MSDAPLKLKKPKLSPTQRMEKVRDQIRKEFEKIEKRLSKPNPPKNGLRLSYIGALEAIAKANLDPLVSISAAKLGIERELFSHQTLLRIIEEGASAEVQKICLKRLLQNIRKPDFTMPNQIGEKSYLFGLMLKIPDELREAELEMIERETSSPIQKAVVEVYLERRRRMRSEDESEYEL